METINDVSVDPSNAEQAKAWDGDEGAYWAAHAGRFDKAMQRYQSAFLDAAGVQPSSRVLDVGCGAGRCSLDAARLAPDGSVLGLDLSSQLLAVARTAASEQGLSNVRFDQADAQIYPFAPGSYDVAISRTSAMFFGDRPAAFANIARAISSGGRLALLVWQAPPQNEWISGIVAALTAGASLPPLPPDAPSPFSLADPRTIEELLGATGFSGVHIEPLSEPMYFGADARDAGEFVVGLSGWMMNALGDADRARAVRDLHDFLAGHETSDGVLLGSATWLVSAVKP